LPGQIPDRRRGRKIEDFAVKAAAEIGREFDNLLQKIDRAIQQGAQEAKDFLQRIVPSWNWRLPVG
jgi:hypothetical protein